jgi:hypothetical protein
VAEFDTPPVALVRFPATAAEPIFVRFEGVEIEVAICTREAYEAKNSLPPPLWGVLGVYVLIGPSDKPEYDTFARPGTTQTRGLLERIDEHALEIDWWRKAALVRRLTRPFDSAETGYLERLLHQVVDNAASLRRPEGSNVSKYDGPANRDDKIDLEERVMPAIKVGLRLAGLQIETRAELDQLAMLKPRRRADEVTT